MIWRSIIILKYFEDSNAIFKFNLIDEISNSFNYKRMTLFFDDFKLWDEVVYLDVIKEQMSQMRNLIM